MGLTLRICTPFQLSAGPISLIARVRLSPGVEDSSEKAVKKYDVNAPVTQFVEVLHITIVWKEKINARVISVTEGLMSKKFWNQLISSQTKRFAKDEIKIFLKIEAFIYTYPNSSTLKIDRRNKEILNKMSSDVLKQRWHLFFSKQRKNNTVLIRHSKATFKSTLSHHA